MDGYSPDTIPINIHPGLVEQHIIRLHDTFNQTTRPRLLPIMNRNSKASVLGHAGNEGCKNRQLADIAMVRIEVSICCSEGRVIFQIR